MDYFVAGVGSRFFEVDGFIANSAKDGGDQGFWFVVGVFSEVV